MFFSKSGEFYLLVSTFFGQIFLNERCDYGYVVPMFRQTFHQRTTQDVVAGGR